jgi:hypothetical protein
MNNINDTLARLQPVDGFIGACLVDSDSGMCLGLVGGGGALNLEVAAAANTEVVRAKRKAMKSLNLKDDIEDILITLGKQYHLIRPIKVRPAVFLYVALDRTRANLAMARFAVGDAEKDMILLGYREGDQPWAWSPRLGQLDRTLPNGLAIFPGNERHHDEVFFGLTVFLWVTERQQFLPTAPRDGLKQPDLFIFRVYGQLEGRFGVFLVMFVR